MSGIVVTEKDAQVLCVGDIVMILTRNPWAAEFHTVSQIVEYSGGQVMINGDGFKSTPESKIFWRYDKIMTVKYSGELSG